MSRLWLIAGVAALAATHAQAQSVQPAQDPSARVGRVSFVEGQVWVKDPSGNEQVSGVINWPVATGTALETGMTSRAEVRVGSSTFRFAPDTKAQFIELSDHTTRIQLEHGSLALRFKDGERARDSWVMTQAGVINFTEQGRYRVDADYDRTNFTVSQGQAMMSTQANSFGLRSGGSMEVTARGDARNTDRFADSFDDWVYALDRREDSRPAPRYVSREMTGYDVLEDNGYWNDVPGYGAVWYPSRVVSDWAPYRYGHWTYLRPWGWTWVDDAPWGFAVSHYGRWGWIGGRWGWVPGAIVPRPVWAPALVAWGGGNGWNFTVNVGSPWSYGWVPLAPAEVYVPWYTVSERYCHSMNRGHITNVTVINNYYRNPGAQHFSNVHVAGAVSAAAAGQSFAARTAAIGSTMGTTAGSMARAAAAAQQNNAPRGSIVAVRDASIAAAAFNQHRIVAPAAVNQPQGVQVAPIPIRVTAPVAPMNNAAGAAAANAARGVAVPPTGAPNAPNAPQVINQMPQSGRPLSGAAFPRDGRDVRDAARNAAQQQQPNVTPTAPVAPAAPREWRGVDPRGAQGVQGAQPVAPVHPQTQVQVPQQAPVMPTRVMPPQQQQQLQRDAQNAARDAQHAAREAQAAARQQREAPHRPDANRPHGEDRNQERGNNNDNRAAEQQVFRRLQER